MNNETANPRATEVRLAEALLDTDFDTAEELLVRGLTNFWDLAEQADPNLGDFSDEQAAYLGVRALKRAAIRFNPELGDWERYAAEAMRKLFREARAAKKFETPGEKALALIAAAEAGELR